MSQAAHQSGNLIVLKGHWDVLKRIPNFVIQTEEEACGRLKEIVSKSLQSGS